MVVLLVLLTFAIALGIDYIKTRHEHRIRVPRGAYISPGLEALGALCNDGGTPIEEQVNWEI